LLVPYSTLGSLLSHIWSAVGCNERLFESRTTRRSCTRAAVSTRGVKIPAEYAAFAFTDEEARTAGLAPRSPGALHRVFAI
jgi:hypothetical protein